MSFDKKKILSIILTLKSAPDVAENIKKCCQTDRLFVLR